MGKKQASQNYGIVYISCDVKTHTIPKPWDERIPILRNNRENTDISQVLLYLIDLELFGTMPAPISGNAQIVPLGNIVWKVISLSGCKFLRKLKVFRKPKQSPSLSHK